MWDSVSEAYGEAVKSALPLHRLLVAVIAILAIALLHVHEYKSIFESLARIEISMLKWGDGGILADSTLGDVFLSGAVVVSGWCFSRILLRLIFALAEGALNLKSVLAQQMAAWPKPALDFSTVKAQIEFLDSTIEPTRKHIRALNTVAEFAAAIGLGFLVCFYWGNILDLLIAILAIAIACYFNYRAINLFLSSYIGPSLHKSSILGRKLPSIFDIP